MNTYNSLIMYSSECKNLEEEIENLKHQLSNSVKITIMKAIDSERQTMCPPFIIYLGGNEDLLDKSYDTLGKICKEKSWTLIRMGHRDFKIDPAPTWKT